jgi:hypothetical protein
MDNSNAAISRSVAISQYQDVITLIFLILLIWYFVRTNLEMPCRKCIVEKSREGLNGINIEDPDILAFMPEFKPEYDAVPIELTPPGEPKPYTFWSGTYGDVPLNLYDVKDIAYKPEWDHRAAIYVPNMRTVFRNTYTPIESTFW